MSIAHLRCGSDIRSGLEQAGIVGDFIEFSDPVCQGPVPAGLSEAEFMAARARFLSTAYGAGTFEQCQTRLAAERNAIACLARYDSIVLWFEHDIYDQSVLIRLLDLLTDAPGLPGALRRHLMDLPWTADGLALTERLALRAVAGGADTPGQVFARLHRDLEPQPFLGDIMFWPALRRLAAAETPALSSFAGWDSPVALTATGRDLLAGRVDWCRLNGIDRWLGGMHLTGTTPAWRWDGKAGRPVEGG